MHTEYHAWESPALGRKAELKVYGNWGRPILAFPCAGGTFYEFEDFGMPGVIAPFLDSGAVKVYAVGSIDSETWLANDRPAGERAQRHEAYRRYIIDEVIPFIHGHQQSTNPITAYGCSLGGYHAMNFYLRHPDVFDSTIALSGVYRLSHFVGDYNDDNVYFNSPLSYLPNLDDPWYLENYRRGKIIACCGQGAWEHECLNDTRALGEIFQRKGIPAWIDIWGVDVHHDWPWWKKQLPFFLGNLLESGR